MKKVFPLLFLLLCVHGAARADHITGGEMYYTFLGNANGQFQYHVTLKLFMRCNSGRQFANPTIIGVFNRASGARISDLPVDLARRETLRLNNPSKCITDPPTVCYEVGFYEFDVSLPPSAAGYILSAQVVFRIAGIRNLAPGYGSIGATYTAEIPGTNATQNNSARFTGSDLVIVCADNSFSYSFAATDADQDELRYSFCEAYQGGSGGANVSAPPAPPPYASVPYSPDYGSGKPLGIAVRVDPNSGLITGVAPATAGTYVVTVCVEEVRNGVVIARQRKDIQINIAPCTVAEAKLQEEYMLCADTKTISVVNLSTSPLINTRNWEFKTLDGQSLYTSTDQTPTFTFPDTGLYRIHLSINKGQECSDSTSAVVRVYPGFHPDFSSSGFCFTKPTRFSDRSTTVYGRVSQWTWLFGDAGSAAGSREQHPQYTYKSSGSKTVQLIAGTTTGCLDTVTSLISIIEKPPIALAFRDTLICASDAVQLQASGNGLFSWSPSANMTNPASRNPTVTPAVTTSYVVTLNDDGCINQDSVRVRVTDRVSLTVMPDTTICQGDEIGLRIQSDAFAYRWTPAVQTRDPAAKNPQVITDTTTVYRVTASIGKCQATEEIVVHTVPYPSVFAGDDTVICYNSHAQLQATIDGNAALWQPAASLNGAAGLQPIATPRQTTAYVCYAYDNRGCPKPGTDTILVTVLPDIVPHAGNDTTAVIAQPLQLQATGGVRYEWFPANSLSNSRVANPVAVFHHAEGSLTYKVLVYNEAGCADSAYLNVTVYKTPPAVFVPNAFSPDGDRRNDVVRPIAAGIEKITAFQIYNRWGQLVFATSEPGRGWDGRVGGRLQQPGTFVWVVQAVDYLGKPYVRRGTVVLVR